MSAMAKSVGRRPTRNQRAGNRQLLVLVVLCVILAVVLIFELPKVLHHGSSGSTSSASSQTNATATSEAAAATANALPGEVPVAAPASVLRAERAIKRLPARDPFVPLATDTTNGSSSAGTAAPAAAAQPVATPASKRPAAASKPATQQTVQTFPELAPTAAVIWTNGSRQVVGVRSTFRVGDASFTLLSVTPKLVKVSLSSKSGTKQISVPRNKAVTVRNPVSGALYTLDFTLPMTTVSGR
jgi:hypothetical protein